MPKRVLRSSSSTPVLDIVKEVVIKEEQLTSKKRKIKYTFQQYELDLLKKYPIPQPITLPQEFVSFHHPEFVRGVEHVLSKDPSLYPLVVHEPFKQFVAESKPATTLQECFQALCRSIIGQQVSGAAANSIEKKFRALYQDNVFPTPEQALETDIQDLRNAGLSARKSEYVKSVAQFFKDGVITLEDLKNLNTEEFLEKLVQIKGIGEWSAKMFLAFSLKKLDVFAMDDLGIARGVSRYIETRPDTLLKYKSVVKLRKSKFDDKKKRDWKVINDGYVELISDDFKPYRTVLMLILWRASSTNIDILS
ncbi:hypothetical protein WICMUC_005962 [Wickerhamomyces mucosus]|uniref:HhH-GPD domain-containing protein n=1 Tax=Wickerhamomyces mucosus TaxID=1378264 RepID=A0A9P8T2A4_9ASCO|nr:hypothetical protein WICMUC_005962 [Wickerhamomyces mucosus]